MPADIRIIQCEGMKVDNSSLTGESDALSRSPEAGHQSALEAKNLAFFSTNCVDGNGYGIVIATGDNTVMGSIAKLVSNIKIEKTPIAIEISRFVKIITGIAVMSGLIFFGIALGFGSTFFQAFIFMIGITVGNVPEGMSLVGIILVSLFKKNFRLVFRTHYYIGISKTSSFIKLGLNYSFKKTIISESPMRLFYRNKSLIKLSKISLFKYFNKISFR